MPYNAETGAPISEVNVKYSELTYNQHLMEGMTLKKLKRKSRLVVLVATKDIKAGEELFAMYDFDDLDEKIIEYGIFINYFIFQ